MTVSLYNSILCRLCCEENSSGIILYDNDSNSGIDICSLINNYLPIKVEDDGKYPRSICPGCNLQLHSTVQFFDLLIEGQKKIRHLWKEQLNREKRREKQQSLLISNYRAQQIGAAPAATELDLTPSTICNNGPISSIQDCESEAVVCDGAEGFELYSTTAAAEAAAAAIFEQSSGDIQLQQQPPQQLQQLPAEEQSHHLTVTHDELVDGLNFEQVVVVNAAENGAAIYGDDHDLVLRVAGLERPRKKRGRPRKQATPTTPSTDPPPTSEQQQQQQQEEEGEGELDVDGRRRRKRKIPLRFREAVQGKELERILKEEGVTDGEEDKEVVLRVALEGGEGGEGDEGGGVVASDDKEVIGHLETSDGQNMGELIIVNKVGSSGSSRGMRSGRRMRRKARFVCEICGRSFMHIGKYRYHKSFHTGIKFECIECKKRFTTKENFELHQKMSGHTGEGIVKETEEGEIKESENEKGTETVDGKVSCEECNKTFSTKQNLETHRKAVHGGLKPFECDVCQKRFGYQNSLKCHVLTHHQGGGGGGDGAGGAGAEGGGGEWPCDICGRRLNHPSSVIYHKEAEHNDGRRFVCDRCGKPFKHKQLLHRHQLVHTNARPHQCQTCPASFKTKANLLSHQATHTGEKRHFCEICGQQFAHKTSLMLHYRWHSGQKPYQCQVCKKAFSQKGNLHEHMRIHTGEKPFACMFCEKRFTTSSQYKLHLKRHTGERPWKCDECGKCFLHKDTWKCHLRRHQNLKPYKCHQCQRQFSEQWALKKHSRLHTGERPYACPLCPKTFADCSNLAKHRKVHVRVLSLNEAMMAAAAEGGEGGCSPDEAAVDAPDDVANGPAASDAGVEFNVWNSDPPTAVGVACVEGGPAPDESEMQQIIYVTYQDPADPSAKVCEKFLMPGSMLDDDGAEVGVGVDLKGGANVLSSAPSTTTLQFTDEHGNPVQITLNDVENNQLQLGLEQGSDGGNVLELQTAAEFQSAVISAAAAAAKGHSPTTTQSTATTNSYIIKVTPDTAAALITEEDGGAKLAAMEAGSDIQAATSYAFMIQNKDQLVATFGTQLPAEYLNLS